MGLTPPGHPAGGPSLLRGLDYSILQQCMHCGLCLPVCPTYDATLMERHSPRGRIALLRAVADGQLEMTPTLAREMYYCLGCFACMTACPAGVNYAEMFEAARAEAELSGKLENPLRRLVRSLTIGWLFMDVRRLKALGRLLRWYQISGVQQGLRRSGLLRLLPRRWQELEAMTPPVQPKWSAQIIPPVLPAVGQRRYRVALLTGCAQDILFSDVNRDTAEVLAANGCEVVTPPHQSCCGSLHAHNGELGRARELARRQLEQFPPENFDAIISNAGGCGSHLRHYSRLLGEDAQWAGQARAWDCKAQDIHEWLVRVGWRAPSGPQPSLRVAYHESCHLAHGQKIVAQPRALLRSIPGLELVELPESNWCCGSAGIYNVIQPDMARRLLERKLAHLRRLQVEVVATGNPGCLLQLINGARAAGMRLRVVHPITLLAEAYRREKVR
ncbi:(Fe-S)-binding protein [Fontisphaera persica]|uniref:(Fe-S)-binding protein n=1 Tax=Fontisphaera persica TaxID=2974023 RepID=UPI0024BF7F8A|nr:(Fe-S)-binding protein [Fontisphaera persica]WCJ60645.1 (Fe-S)-binding protein [Fontisphaera persica]